MATYQDFEDVDGKMIPSNLDFKVETVDKKVRISIHFTKMQIDRDATYPFRIPESYKELKDLQPTRK